MRRSAVATSLALALMTGGAIAIVGYNRYSSMRSDERFAAAALKVRQVNLVANPTAFVREGETYRYVTADEVTSAATRTREVFMEAKEAAIGLDSEKKRKLALRWLDLQQRIGETKSAIENTRVLRDYIDPCGSYTMTRLLTQQKLTPKQLGFITYCRREGKESLDRLDAEGKALRTKLERFEVDAAEEWNELVSISPRIGRAPRK